MSPSAEDNALSEFLAESEEILVRVSSNLGRLEKGDCSQEQLDELYRDIHTLKGTAFLFGFGEVGALSHAMETCLDPVRKGRIVPQRFLLDELFRCVDLLEAMVRAIAAGGLNDQLRVSLEARVSRLVESAVKQFGNDLNIRKDLKLPRSAWTDAKEESRFEPPKEKAPQKEQENAPRLVAEAEKKEPVETSAATENAQDSTIRVQVGLLDRLMNLVGEMVLVRNQVLQYSNQSEDLAFLSLSQRLDVVTSDLQDQVMRTRMQPIGTVVSKFQRVIRDLARDLNKRIDLTIQGKDTELDKTLLEAIKDPLTHIVRNCCDHGIENPDERKTQGKPETGHVLVSSFHEGGQVVVEISDDGRGLSRKKILKKALEKNLITEDQASNLADREVLSLIFLPGFSTAEQVSSVSGRGVGMDVVRTNIEKIGGSVELESVEGKGTTIRLRIPLTLAIVPAMLIRSGDAVFAIPQSKLQELVRAESGTDGGRDRVRMLQGRPVYELRGKILPLVSLREVLGKGSLAQDQISNVVVLNLEGGSFGLVVDEVLDTADIVVKPLSQFLKSLDVFSAATILGNGEIALILDPAGIAKVARLASSTGRQEGAFAAQNRSENKASDAQEYLFVQTQGRGRYAVPLCLVSRLEEFSKTHVEYSGDQALVQYRDSLLSLVDVNRALGFGKESAFERDKVSTVVIQRGGALVGLVVNAILDVALIENTINDEVKDRAGILGGVIWGNEVVTVIDVLGIIDQELKTASLGSGSGGGTRRSEGVRPKILYAEDVPFFRKQVTKVLLGQGWEVVTVEDGKAALELLRSPQAPVFSLVLSDIEMPKMGGYELARSIREIERLRNIPLVALTTRFSQRDVEEGLRAGFDAYLEKLNPEVLIREIDSRLGERKAA